MKFIDDILVEVQFSDIKNGTIEIPQKVKVIGTNAFKGVPVKTLVIPDNVIEIKEYAFRNCTTLKSIVVPDSVLKIGEGAFYGCDELLEIRLPNGIGGITDFLFLKCGKLHHVNIPKSVKSIGVSAFFSVRNCRR